MLSLARSSALRLCSIQCGILASPAVAFSSKASTVEFDEPLVLVDSKDSPIGSKPKSHCHQWKDIAEGNCLHRAFSVFLFDSNQNMVIQKRSSHKLTFPGIWTNACCSHPLYNPVEMDESGAKGVKRAVKRKLAQELSIPEETFSFSRLNYMTRLIYRAQSEGSPYGEHELDYLILAVLRKEEEAQINPHPKEIEQLMNVTAEKLEKWIKEKPEDFSPWFKIAMSNFVFKFWMKLDNLTELRDHETIHDFR